MKKVQKTLTGAMAAVMATGMATPVMAAPTNVDAIYKAAYNATMKALQTKTQEAVNEARIAIKALPATLESAIGEFSKQLDTVQHPILVNIVTAIKTAQTTPTQANVNAAKASLVKGLPQVWLNSYSSAVDVVQQDLMNKVVAAVKLAETSKEAANVEAAKKLVADLATATSEAIKTVATGLKTRVEAVKIYALDVTKVKSLDRYQIEVEFDALTESLKDITVEVVDSKGKVHQVSTKSLLKGSKSTKFDFTSLVGISELQGVWTVNGVKYDVTEATLVENVLDNLGDEADFAEALANLQDEEYIEDVLGKYNRQDDFVFDKYDGESVGYKYIAALKDKKTAIKNASDVQAIIDKVNGELAGDVTVEKLIELAKDSSVTSKQFFAAMTNIDLEKVNEEWASTYKSSIGALNVDSKLKAVQEAVYTANKTKVTTGASSDITAVIDAIMSSSAIKLNRTKAETKLNLVEAYYKDDTEKLTEKADLVKSIKIQIALLDLKGVEDVTDLNPALENLSDVVNDADKFSYEKNINENIVEDYFDGFEDNDSVLEAVDVKEVKTLANAIQAAVFADEVGTINEDTLYETLTSKKLGLKNVTDANKAEYVKDIDGFDGKSTYDAVQNIVDAINARIAMTKATTKAEMRTALVTLVEKSDSDVLDGETTAQIADLAEEFLNAKDEEDIALGTIADVVGDDFDYVLDVVDGKINTLNSALATHKAAPTDVTTTAVIAALEEIIGEDKVKSGMFADFIKETTKTDGTYKTYEDYTAVRKALGL